MSPAEPAPASRSFLLYDGECPFCSRYSDWIRVRDRFGLELLNAREHPELVAQLAGRGYDIDSGMILQLGDSIYHGADAIRALDGQSERRGWSGRVAHAMVKVPGLIPALYPLIRAARIVTLRMMGKRPNVRG